MEAHGDFSVEAIIPPFWDGSLPLNEVCTPASLSTHELVPKLPVTDPSELCFMGPTRLDTRANSDKTKAMHFNMSIKTKFLPKCLFLVMKVKHNGGT